jgi:hypothetical protein
MTPVAPFGPAINTLDVQTQGIFEVKPARDVPGQRPPGRKVALSPRELCDTLWHVEQNSIKTTLPMTSFPKPVQTCARALGLSDDDVVLGTSQLHYNNAKFFVVTSPQHLRSPYSPEGAFPKYFFSQNGDLLFTSHGHKRSEPNWVSQK